MRGVPGKVPEKTGWPSWWNYAREGSGGSERSPNCWRVQSYPGGRGGVRISRPPAVCRACLELLLQGAEAEVRLLRQGRLPLLAAAQGSRAMLHRKRIHRSVSCAGAEGTGARTASCQPRRGLRTTSATCPAHLPCWRRDLRARCRLQFGLEPFSLQPLRTGAGAG